MRSTLETRVARFAARHELLPPARSVLALVSGGADSTCLMHLLAAVHDGPVGVLAFDHGLRPRAADEAGTVMAAARSLGLPTWMRSLDLKPGTALQERARDARRAAALDVARREGFDLIATGHTASDQAETVLFRIARGTGRTGALGMAPRDGVWIRPLLCATATETRAWCAEHRIATVDDPSNADPAHRRARVRHELLPALERVHPGAELAVTRFADLLRDEGAVLDDLVGAAWERCTGPGGGLAVAALARESPAVARLLVRRLLAAAGLPAESERVDRIRRLVEDGGRPIQVPGGLVALDRGVLRAEAALAECTEVRLDVPGSAVFGNAVLHARRVTQVDAAPRATSVAVTATGPFTVRAPRAGDRLPLAGGGTQALGKLLAGAGVPARHRSGVPVVVQDRRVVWVAGYRADPTLIAAPGARATVLEVTPA